MNRRPFVNKMMNHRITIQRQLELEDEHGISRRDWHDVCTVSSTMNNLSGREYWAAKEQGTEKTVEFTIRYKACKDLSANDRIVYKGRVFNIISPPDNVQYQNQILKIKALEVMS